MSYLILTEPNNSNLRCAIFQERCQAHSWFISSGAFLSRTRRIDGKKLRTSRSRCCRPRPPCPSLHLQTGVRGAKGRQGGLGRACHEEKGRRSHRRQSRSLPRREQGNAEIAIWRKSATIKAGKKVKGVEFDLDLKSMVQVM